MDTGSTLYKKFQKQLARKKHLKRKDAAAKAAKTRKENQRKRNEEAGLGYFSDNQVKAYKKMGEDMKKEWLKNREQKRKEGYKAYLNRKHAEMRAREREKAREKKKAAEIREKERIRNEKKRARESAKKHAKEPLFAFFFLILHPHSMP